jgi:hypothetical protein
VKELAQDILSSLTSNDWFFVQTLEATPQGPGGCFANQLADNNANNLNFTQSWLTQLVANGGQTNFQPAFDFIPSILANSHSGRAALPTAVFVLASGKGADVSSNPFLPTLNTNTSVFTVAIAVSTGSTEDTFLRDMNNRCNGMFSTAGSSNDVGEALEPYRIFAAYQKSGIQNTCTITPPYFDAGGLDLVLTVACPVHRTSDQQLAGVAAADIPIVDLMQDLAKVSAVGGWGILIDREKRTYVHPKLVSPLSVNQLPNFVDIENLESGNSLFLNTVLPSFSTGGSGSATGPYDQIIGRGLNSIKGSEIQRITVAYHWAPINNTDFLLCIVIPVNSLSKPLYPGQESEHYYHRLDVNAQGLFTGFDPRRNNFRTNARNCYYEDWKVLFISLFFSFSF